MKEEKIVLDEFHYHEVLDRCYCVTDIIESMLLTHPAVEQTPEWKEKIEKAQEILLDLYLLIGSKR